MNRTSKKGSWAFAAVVVALPLLLTYWWGTVFPPDAYRLLQAAQQLGKGDLAMLDWDTATRSAFYILPLALGRAHAPVAAFLSALGWSFTAMAVYWTLARLDQPPSGVLAALLIVVNPLIPATAGAPYSWVLALGWLALGLNTIARPTTAWMVLKLCLLLLMLGLHFDPAVLAFSLAVLLTDGLTRHFGWWPAFAYAGLAFLVTAASLLLGAVPAAGIHLPTWVADLPSLGRDYQLWWLFVPAAAAGLAYLYGSPARSGAAPSSFQLLQQTVALGGLWAVSALLVDSALAPGTTAVLLLVLNSLGIIAIVRFAQRSSLLNTTAARQPALIVALLLLPLLLALLLMARSGATIARTNLAAAEAAAAKWIFANTAPSTTLLASPRVGYLAQRPGLAFPEAGLTRQRPGALFEQLFAAPPEYVVSARTTGWDTITRSGWFKERYAPLQQIENPYTTAAPLTIWQYQQSGFDAGEVQAVNARVPEHFELVGYKSEPHVFTPGDDIFVTLYLRALRPVAHGFITGIHLTAPDGWVWAWREEQTPRSLSGSWWQPGQVITERFTIPTSPDLPSGAYQLETFWRAADDDDTQLPVYQGGDENVLDRVKLGFVLAPGEAAVAGAAPIGARFSEQIILEQAAIGTAAPGEPLAVDLVWQALSQPDGDYTVFVHVLNAAGEIVAAHDSKPVNNRFPTQAFLPGTPVVDRHELALPADLPPGEYRLQVGLYQLESGERLPVWDQAGLELPDRTLPFGTILIGEP